MMKVGKLGLSFRADFVKGSRSNSFTPLIPDLPRTYISGSAFGSDPQSLLVWIRNEGSKVCNALMTFDFETDINSSLVTVTEFPVKLVLRTFPYPVTTTSFISLISGLSETNISVCPFFRFTSLVSIPTNDTSKVTVSLSRTSIVNFPCESVTTP